MVWSSRQGKHVCCALVFECPSVYNAHVCILYTGMSICTSTALNTQKKQITIPKTTWSSTHTNTRPFKSRFDGVSLVYGQCIHLHSHERIHIKWYISLPSAPSIFRFVFIAFSFGFAWFFFLLITFCAQTKVNGSLNFFCHFFFMIFSPSINNSFG